MIVIPLFLFSTYFLGEEGLLHLGTDDYCFWGLLNYFTRVTGCRVTGNWALCQKGYWSKRSWVKKVTGQKAHRSKRSRVKKGRGKNRSQVKRVTGKKGRWPKRSRVKKVMGQKVHGSKRSWVKKVRCQKGHGSKKVDSQKGQR
jgi:hypothetical protein